MARIAFFTFNAYEMLTGGHDSDAVGGAQLQQILIAEELADRGHKVFFIEYDTARKSEEKINGIQVITKPRPSGSAPIRAFDAIKGTMKILREIELDVCYRRVLNFELLPISFYTSFSDCRFVYGISHDDELTDKPHLFSQGIKSTNSYKRLNQFALSTADAVIAQNSHQYDLAVEQLNTEVYNIPNCYKVRSVQPIDWEYDSPVVFWAARFQPWKQPEVVASLAEALPSVTFVMAGAPGDEKTYNKLEQSTKSLENVHLIGYIPLEQIDRYFSAADIFLNTSSKEGFPNTFLQAWAQGTPVASLQVDPNNIISEEEIGIIADGSTKKLEKRLKELTQDKQKLEKLGRANKEYLKSNHTVDTITSRYEHVLLGDKTRN